MNDTILSEPTRGYWIISGIALAWNLLGVMAYLMQVTMSPDDMAALSEAERTLYAATPTWVTAAYAIAVFAGVLGSIGLLLRKSWSILLLALSLAGILLQMGYVLLIADTIELLGTSVVFMPVVIILVGVYLVAFSRSSKAQGYFT